MATMPRLEADPEDKNLIILQSLICLLREKNVLSRADIEELRDTVERRAAGQTTSDMPCCTEGARAAATEIAQIGDYVGRRFGGKHRRFQA